MKSTHAANTAIRVLPSACLFAYAISRILTKVVTATSVALWCNG
jgi:hypothetical protein